VQGNVAAGINAPVSAGEMTGTRDMGGGFAGPSVARSPAEIPGGGAALRSSRIAALPPRDQMILLAPGSVGSVIAAEASANKPMTEYQRRAIEAQEGSLALGTREEERRVREQERKQVVGTREVRTSPTLGIPIATNVTTDAEGRRQVRVLGPDLKPMLSASSDELRNYNVAIRTASRIATRLGPDLTPEGTVKPTSEFRAIFTPFIGKKWADIQKSVGTLTPRQQSLMTQILQLRNARLAPGGKQLTITEERLYSEVLPNMNTIIDALPQALRDSLQNLTDQVVEIQRTNEQSGRRPGPAEITRHNRAYYKQIRRDSRRAFREEIRVRPGPDEVLVGAGVPPAAASAMDQPIGADELDRAFLQ